MFNNGGHIDQFDGPFGLLLLRPFGLRTYIVNGPFVLTCMAFIIASQFGTLKPFIFGPVGMLRYVDDS